MGSTNGAAPCSTCVRGGSGAVTGRVETFSNGGNSPKMLDSWTSGNGMEWNAIWHAVVTKNRVMFNIKSGKDIGHGHGVVSCNLVSSCVMTCHDI